MGGGPTPLPTLLSQALVAFTIELDNEWERRMPHRTTNFGGTRGPWATSLRQWSNFMQWVPADGITVAELTRAARAEPPLHAMRRWGYVDVEARLVRPRRGGLRAQEVWRELPSEIEGRWRERFGANLIGGLRGQLSPLLAAHEAGLPDWITHTYGGYAVAPMPGSAPDPARPRPLSALLSIPLQAFTLRYEQDSVASLMYTANILRSVGTGEDGVAVAELPRTSGVAPEALHPAIGILLKRGFVEQGSGRGRRVRLTDAGAAEFALYAPACAAIELEWGLPTDLRASLESLLAGGAPLAGARPPTRELALPHPSPRDPAAPSDATAGRPPRRYVVVAGVRPANDC